MNPHHYQHEKIGAAISWLLIPDLAFAKKLEGAMAELSIAYRTAAPTPSAVGHFEKIKQIMGTEPWQERALWLTLAERRDIVMAFWELHRAVSRDYYAYEAQR
jgi:hypothetical protein